MFRKSTTTTTAIIVAAFAAVIVLSSQGSASATEVGTFEDTCAETGICFEAFHGFHDWSYPHPAGIDVEGGFVADPPVALTPTLPDDVLSAITGPVLDLSMLPGFPSLPETAPADPAPAPADPAPAPADPAPAPADPAPADPAPEDPAPAPADPAPAPVDLATADPAPAPEDSPDTAGSTGAGRPVVDPEIQRTATTSTSTTTTTPTNQDDDVDELVVAAIDPTTDEDSGEAFDPAMAALLGGLGALGLFTVGTAAFVIGRRGA